MITARRELKRRVQALRRIPFVGDCTSRELHRIDRLGSQLDIRAGSTLTQEGAVGNECFIVLNGAAIAEHAGRRLGAITEGSIVGEMALLDRTTRNATVVAATPMRLWVFNKGEFEQLLETSPKIQQRISRVAAERRVARVHVVPPHPTGRP
jgi:CRP-like cAMP-binding protein